MKKLEISKMEFTVGSSNRQCLIDGVLTAIAVGVGFAAGGFGGAAGGLLGGLFAGNSNGCF